jgi:hypothetical protein
MGEIVSEFRATLAAAIGHGSSTPGKIGSIVMMLLGVLFALLSVGSKTRIGGAFTHGKAGSSPISPAGRVIGLLTALALVIAGVKGLLK